MKLRSLFSEAVTRWRRYFHCLMHAECVRMLLVLTALVPLMLILYPGAELLALLSLPIYFLTVPPLAHNQAEMMITAAREEIWISLRLASPDGYRRKVLRGLAQAVWLLVSLIPAASCVVYVRLVFSGTTDGLTVLRGIAGLAGGDWVGGLAVALLIGVASLLPFMLMCALRSWHTHGCALGVKRGFMRGRRLRLLCVWLAGAASYLPFLIAAAVTVFAYAASLPASIAALISGDAVLPSPMGAVIALIAAYIVLLVPARSLRRVLISTFMLHETNPLKEDGQ